MAHPLIERLRGKLPYIRRLRREIDDLRHGLAIVEQQPLIHQTVGDCPVDLGREFRTFLRLLRPHDVPGRRKRRIGGQADGGYVMLDDFAPVRNALSLGVGRDISWDQAMAASGVEVFQYDPAVSLDAQDKSERLHFHCKRVVAAPRAPEDITLAEIMGLEALAGDTDVVAKIDIEGGEWEVLADIETAVLARVRQLAIELHWLREFASERWRAIAFRALHNLTRTHCCIHVHGTNWAPFVVIGGIPFPHVVEATFVRRTDHATVPSAAVFPTDLDRPCDPKKPDLYLGGWNY